VGRDAFSQNLHHWNLWYLISFAYVAEGISKSMLTTMQKRKRKQYYTIFQTGNGDFTLKASSEEMIDNQHGLAHKRGNHSKPDVLRNLFRVFVDTHRIPNGKTSSLIKYFLEPSIKRIGITKANCPDPENSLSFRFAQFVQIVQEIGLIFVEMTQTEPSVHDAVKDGVGESTVYRWFSSDFPDTQISPHYTDYCANCALFKKLKDSYKVSLSKHKMQDILDVAKMTKLENQIAEVDALKTVHVQEVKSCS
jgi:hypothetical protein